MGLEMMAGEEVPMVTGVVTGEVPGTVGGGCDVDGWRRTRRRLSTSSWNGSTVLMLCERVGPGFCNRSRLYTEGKWYNKQVY